MTLFILVSFLAALVISLYSWHKVKNDQFYSDVPQPLLAIGIYVWGDGLVIGPFWLVATLFWAILAISPLNIVRFYLLFLIIRSTYEVMYWINHQMFERDYVPPLFRKVEWLNAEQHGILYQLLHMCLIVLAISLLLFTFN